MSVCVGYKLGKATKRHAYISEYYCGWCGFPVSDHDSFCPECGGAFREKDATERTCHGIPYKGELKCSVCDIDWEYDYDYCPYCGSKVMEQ